MSKTPLSAGKAKLAQFLAIPKGLRDMTLKEFAEKELGITEQTLHHWKKDPQVISHMNSKIYHDFFRCLPDVMNSLKLKALTGDTHAVRLFLGFVEKFSSALDQVEKPVATAEEVEAFIARFSKGLAADRMD